MKINKYVTEYIDQYESGKVLLNQERIDLIKYLREYVFTEDLYFDNEQIENFVKFAQKWFFPLRPFQKFLIAFVFLYKQNGKRYYRDFLWMMGRGSGKNGLISALAAFLISPLNGIRGYDGSIIANSEDQAKTSVKEIADAVHDPKNAATLERQFYATQTLVRSKSTNSTLRFRTSNGNTKDGLRDGFVIFDEIHEYQDDSNVKVHISGLGKKPNSRIFYIGTDGYVRDGFIDKKKALAANVLSGKAKPDTIFPWIAKLDNRDEIDDPHMWEKSVPMLSKPITGYAEDLVEEIEKDYADLADNPSGLEEFLTKRMDIPSQSMESSVAPWDEIAATNQPIPDDLDGREAIAAVDFATVRDFVAAAVTIKANGKLVTLEHQWALKSFVDKYYGYSRKNYHDATPNKRIEIPIREWEDAGHIDILSESMIDPQHAVQWLLSMRERFNIKKVVMDNYRATIYRKLLEDAGFEVMVIKNPTAIDGLLATIIDDGFPQQRFIWGDNPLLRWNTNNVLVKTDKRGNKQYLKKEEIRRKTDGFKAFEYTLYAIDYISDVDVSGFLSAVVNLDF
uniref:terminase TerL endonuclease subunit n=1 Tax=Lacticaseibacillus saniviri TaxID=931533 RepID=UPI000704ABB2|nr:terminase TerL endonuclease subunit [Lacticaseibacillus saniviri]